MFNAVGGSTILYAGHFPRLHPSDFRVRTLDGVADDWPIDYATLEPYYAVNDRMMGVSGPGRRSRLPAEGAAAAAGAARQARRDAGARVQLARLALVAVGQRDRHRGVRGSRPLHQRRALSRRLRPGREGEHRRHLLAAWRSARGVELRTRCRVREITVDADGHGRRRRSTTTPTASSACRRAEVVVARLQRHRHAAPAAQLPLVAAFPDGLANSQRPGRQEPHVPSLRARWSALRRAPRRLQGPDGCCIVEPGVLRDRSGARTSCAATPSRSCAAFGPVHERASGACARAHCLGRGHHAALRGHVRPRRRAWWRSARTCPRSTTA